MGRPEYINDDDGVINLSEFKQSSNQRKIPCHSIPSMNNNYILIFIFLLRLIQFQLEQHRYAIWD